MAQESAASKTAQQNTTVEPVAATTPLVLPGTG